MYFWTATPLGNGSSGEARGCPLARTGSITAGTSAQSPYAGKSNENYISLPSQVTNFTLSGVATPEPSPWALTGVALCGLAFFARRTKAVKPN